MYKEVISEFQSALQDFAKEKLIESGFTGEEFFFENLKDSNGVENKKATLNIGLEDKTYHVFHADTMRFATVDFSAKSVARIFMSDKLFNQLPLKPDYTTVIESSGWAKVTTQSVDYILSIAKEAFEIALKSYHPNEVFGCCSRYVQCSDAGKCLHPCQLYALGCQYRVNLEAGSVFYGVHKNV